MHTFVIWGCFGLFVVSMLVLDLTVFQKKSHAIHIKEALLWSLFWIGLALLFNIGVFIVHGPQTALNFLAGYLLEESLSVDNLFVFLLIFSYFRVPSAYQHKVLFWGILGAMIMRMVFIVAGVALIKKFQWIIYLFGGFLVLTGIKLAVEEEKEIHPENNPVLKLLRRFVGVTNEYVGEKFFVPQSGRWMATPLFVVLLIVETTDVMFAVDSIPAVLGITTDPFIVYTSNIFAILGLRSLYFALAGLMKLFHYLNYGLAVILVFVGIKMLISAKVHIPIGWALGFILVTLLISVGASVLFPERKKEGDNS